MESIINKSALVHALSNIQVPALVSTPPAQLADQLFDIGLNKPPERAYPPYELMVHRLFKVLPDAGEHASAMHAAIGLSGEAAEYLMADCRKNIIEEAGDIEFYIQALKLQVKMDYTAAVALGKADTRAIGICIGNVFSNVVTLTGDILDVTKKAWVYKGALNNVEISRLVLLLELNLELIYELFGTTRADVQHANQVKLIGPGGRFESGFYSDSAAIARNDKVVGEGRKFMGQKPADPVMEPAGKVPEGAPPAEAVDWTLQTR